MEERVESLRKVLDILQTKMLFINPKKSELCRDKLVFLGNVISAGGLSMDPKKIKAILEWPTPRNSTEVKIFHGMVNFYKGSSGISVG